MRAPTQQSGLSFSVDVIRKGSTVGETQVDHLGGWVTYVRYWHKADILEQPRTCKTHHSGPSTFKHNLSTLERAQPYRAKSLPEIGSGALQAKLFRDTHKKSAGQFAVFTCERCVVALVVLTKNGYCPGVVVRCA